MNLKKMGFSAALAVGTLCLSFGVGSTAHAATISSLSDNFDAETQSLNYKSFANWAVSAGTVDLIGSGGPFDFYPGNGNYVDLDGTSKNAGILTTKNNFAAGTYALSFLLGGSTRGDSNTVTLNFGTFTEAFTLASNAPLAIINRTVTLGALGKLSFSNAGGDNVGLILDNVNVAVVPTPALLPALLGLGAAALRKRKGEAAKAEA